MRGFLPLAVCMLAIPMPALTAAEHSAIDLRKVELLARRAHEDLKARKPQLAIPLLRQIVSQEPNNLEARGNLGVLLFFQGKYAQAITQLRAALRLQPDLWKIQALLGIAEKRTGDPKSAMADLERAFPRLSNKSIQKQAGLELIEIDSSGGELDKAASVISKLEAVAPQDPQVLFAAYRISMQMMDQALLSMMMAAPDSAEMHMMMADQFVLQGDRAKAIAQYREAIRLNPRLPGVHFELAEQLENAPDPSLKAQAEHEYEAALAVNQYDEKAWLGLGKVMESRGDLSAAKEDYVKALALQPRDAGAETAMAITLIHLDEKKHAVSLLQRAVKDDPTDLVAHYRLSTLYREAGRSEDSRRELNLFLHYKALKEKLGKVFRQMRAQGN